MRNKEKIIVSSEVKTILYDLFNQIQYELIEQYEEFKKENEKLKDLIDTILNFSLFKEEECPMNFVYDEETNENKAQEVFCQDDDYCENNCNGDYKKCWLKYFNKMHELERSDK